MSVEWKRVEELFEAAAELEPVLRAGFLSEACGDDRELFEEVQALLACESKAAGFFDGAIGEVASSLTDDALEDRRIGPYRVLHKLGQGGMGAVYLAVRDDDQYRKFVALKLVRQGMDTPWLLERFRYERQILASLEHPHIARMLDGGTTEDGLPYIVMEYVEGQPLTVYCESQHLDIPTRLRLFNEVCSAVEYAHRKLVIHRDLKPANILIAADGTPRLLDFGTAKLVSPEFADASQTQVGEQMLTPDYASPEQLRGEQVTTASDVYSLGVILFELLTGRRPFDTRSRASALERAITGTDAPAPSLAAAHEPKLVRALTGDLDNIVVMAMRKEAERRYASVEQFSADIRRYLEGLPVRARADTASYRAGKFLRRNRFAVGVVAAAVLALFGGIFIALWQAREARLSADRAQRRFADVRQLANTFLFDVQDRLRSVPGTLAVRKTLVDTALVHLDKLSREADDDPGLQLELAGAYDRVGRILGNPAEANLGNPEQAIENSRKAVGLFDKAVAAQPANEAWLLAASAGYRRYAEALNLKNSHEANQACVRSVELGRQAFAIGRGKERFDNLRAGLTRLAEYQRASGDNAGALASAQQALDISQQLALQHPGAYSQRALALGYCAVGTARRSLGEVSLAAENYAKCKDIREAMLASGSGNAGDRRNLGLLYMEIAKLDFILHAGDFRYAARTAEKALLLLQALARDDGDARASNDEASAQMLLGSALRTVDATKARSHFLAALHIRQKLGNAPADLSKLASTHKELGFLALTAGNKRLAREHLEEAIALNNRALQAEPGRKTYLATMVGIQLLLVDMHRAARQWTQAEHWMTDSIATATRLNEANDDPSQRTWLADALIAGGKVRQAQGDPVRAAEMYRRSLAIWNTPPLPTSPQARRRRDEAESLLGAVSSSVSSDVLSAAKSATVKP